MWFSKQVSCINSPNGDIIKPDSTMMLDYEVELAFVIGESATKSTQGKLLVTYSVTWSVTTLA